MNERDRIELIMKSYNLTPSQFADKTGIQRASVSHILSGRNKPSLEVMLKIYESFPGLDMKWLMTGTGEAPQSLPLVSLEKNDNSIEKELFPVNDVVERVEQIHPIVEPRLVEKPSATRQNVGERVVRRSQSLKPEKKQERDSSPRRIKEIRIFYTDGTYETMIPER